MTMNDHRPQISHTVFCKRSEMFLSNKAHYWCTFKKFMKIPINVLLIIPLCFKKIILQMLSRIKLLKVIFIF